ncbi:uncharacterized protein [Chelonus insularis]|uniref:uncharacterized protein n=1 Tax=Chelonus insularis TaxID=460826 RepID=UPI00158F551B|nr:uncharacterized protein LOC118064557 [Chelonus insularis]
MPTVISAQDIEIAQDQHDELESLLQRSTSLKLQKLVVEPDTEIYYDITNGIVRPYVPKSLRRTAFHTIHGLAHPSGCTIAKTCRECIECQHAKVQRHNRVQPLGIEVPDGRFNHVNIDIVNMPTVDDYKYCLTIIDRFTRWPVVVSLENITASTVATALFTHWISQFGTPLTITTNQDPQFESTLFRTLTNFVGANRTRSSPYYPASNGLIECWHCTLKAGLMCKPDIPWTSLLPSVSLGLRTCYKPDLGA